MMRHPFVNQLDRIEPYYIGVEEAKRVDKEGEKGTHILASVCRGLTNDDTYKFQSGCGITWLLTLAV